MKTAYFYRRLSSKKQLKETSTGLERQEKIQSICKEYGWTPSTKTFADLGVSAYTGKNRLKGDLGLFINLAKEHKLGEHPILCLEAFDRFSRQDIDESEPALIELLKCGVDIYIHFTKQIFTKASTKEVSDRIQILVALKQAYDYSANLSKRIKDSQGIKKSRMENGQVLKWHHVPKYYSYDEHKRQYVQNDAAEIVKEIIKKYMAGESPYLIAKWLNAQNIPSLRFLRSDCQWAKRSVVCLLSRKSLCGEIEGIKGYIAEPVITKAEWEKIQVRLNKRSQGKFTKDFTNIFRGLIKCPCCHEAMNVGTVRKNRDGSMMEEAYRYVRCSRIGNGKPCKNKHQRDLRDIETEFFVEALKQDPEALFNGHDDNKLSKTITEKEFRMKKISDEITKWIAMSDVPEVEAKVRKLNAEREAIKSEIASLNLQRLAHNPKAFTDFQKLFLDDMDLEEWMKYDKGVRVVMDKLKDDSVRKQLTTILPSLIERIDIDNSKREWTVFNKAGKPIYTSESLDYTCEN